MLREYLTSIANKLRELLGTTDTINAQNFTSKIDEVYNAGYEKGKSEGGGASECNSIHLSDMPDWIEFFKFDARSEIIPFLRYSDTSKGKSFESMFYGIGTCDVIPELDTSNGESFMTMFCDSSVKTISGLNTSKGKNFHSMCAYAWQLTNIEGTLDLSGAQYSSAIRYMFDGCGRLEKVTFEGIINITENLDMFSSCNNLTVDSAMSFINALADNSGQSKTYTVNIGSVLTKLTEEQKAIATAKNIKLA